MSQNSISASQNVRRLSVSFLLATFFCTYAFAQQTKWSGEWITDFGAMKMEQAGNRVTGDYGPAGNFEGVIERDQLKLTYKSGNSNGKAEFALAENGASFAGKWIRGSQSGTWRGWKKDSQAPGREHVDYSGVWLTTIGTMQLKQEGSKVSGSYGAEGWSTIAGTAEGGRLNLTWKRIKWSGSGWLEQTPDGKRIFGSTEGDKPEIWLGLRLDGFEHHAEAKAGTVIEGRTDNGMLYFLRMPDNWQSGQPTDVIVLLHGSNWTTKGMVHVTANKWPELAKRFAILGIQGQSWSKWSNSDDLRFNYTYVNWMGKSTYKGYPYTDRESPYLVMQTIDELNKLYKFNRIFVGGHSQGAYLTYVLHMHYPDKLDGTFPLAGGLIIQAEPDVFDDEKLQAAQRKTPMVIVHGQKDRVVRYSTGVYNYHRFLAHDFHQVKFLNPRLGHPYDFLPIGKAIEYLDAMSTTDEGRLLEFANEQVKQKNWREVGAAIQRAQELKAGRDFAPVWKAYQQAAKLQADRHLQAIQANPNGKWVDRFLKWHEQFASSKAGAEAVAAFQLLREEHDKPAKKMKSEAQTAFRSGKRDEGWAKYQEIVDKYYASRLYLTIKESLRNR